MASSGAVPMRPKPVCTTTADEWTGWSCQGLESKWKVEPFELCFVAANSCMRMMFKTPHTISCLLTNPADEVLHRFGFISCSISIDLNHQHEVLIQSYTSRVSCHRRQSAVCDSRMSKSCLSIESLTNTPNFSPTIAAADYVYCHTQQYYESWI